MSRDRKSGVIIMIALVSTMMVVASSILLQQPLALAADLLMHSEIVRASIAISGNIIYIAWPNNDTGHWGVFFAKSTDGGKTLSKTIMLSAPNKGNAVHLNVDVAASGNNVIVTWWTNTTGVLMPVFKSSSDTGKTFGKTMILNSTISGKG
jgi:hypothetical protein